MATVPLSAAAALAPVAGSVAGISRAVLTTGCEVSAVMLDPGAEAVAAPAPASRGDGDGEAKLKAILAGLQPADLSRHLDKLKAAGVWADRWSSPDLLGQVTHCLKRPIDTIVCSTLDLDDALPLQHAIATEHALEIVAALAVLAAVTGAPRATVVLDGASSDACNAAFEHLTRETGVRLVRVRNSYPQPNPTLLLHALAGRHLSPGRLPTEAGALVLDAAAAAAVGRCFLYDEPMLQAQVGVADVAHDRHHLLSVPVGSSLGETLHACGIHEPAVDLRGGSPLRDIRLNRDCVIAGGEVAIYVVGVQPATNPQSCIRCGWCVSGCPVHIHPAGILEAAQVGDRTAGERYGLDACIECGVCSYVCPSRLPLLDGIRLLRNAPRSAI